MYRKRDFARALAQPATDAEKRQFFLLQALDDRKIAERPIEQHALDFQADFRILSSNRRNTLTVDSWRRIQVRARV